ncbi:hypothetical protein AVEN_22150-1 [Araneus ventricosus]|uniref:Cuticle protein 16.8 n=1 Tax=Araneus ventricosus TaxID=182803 RepID=A0A4Y2KKU2_ARAVE|nr:hypothetical protein AVEN_22150-1 [Araneus ventricosus]
MSVWSCGRKQALELQSIIKILEDKIGDPDRNQHAEEVRDHVGAVAGRYGYLDARGIGRQVNYVADHAELRARVHTNEPAVVPNTPVAARVVPDGLLARGVVPVSTYVAPVLAYDYGANGYGLGYDGCGPGYGIADLGYGYGGALGYNRIFGNYGGVYISAA